MLRGRPANAITAVPLLREISNCKHTFLFCESSSWSRQRQSPNIPASASAWLVAPGIHSCFQKNSSFSVRIRTCKFLPKRSVFIYQQKVGHSRRPGIRIGFHSNLYAFSRTLQQMQSPGLRSWQIKRAHSCKHDSPALSSMAELL